MYFFTLRVVALLIVFTTMLFSPQAQAVTDTAEIVNKAGMQRMLSQRIAKAYLYLGNDISVKEAQLQLEQALERFKNNHALLKANVQDSETKDLLSFVEGTLSEYRTLANKPYSKESAARILELSDILLEACHSVTLNIEGKSGVQITRIVNISGKQRMLSQQVAKFYIAYQAGFRDDDTVGKLKKAISDFESGIKTLREEGSNNGEIDSLLTKTEKEWARVSPYFLKVREGGLPLMVMTATDEITKLADRITGLYTAK